MKTVKRLLLPQRLRQVPEQFSWIDQALVQRHLIDRCDARAAALYLFLVTVADAQGLSYYGCTSLMQRLRLSSEELGAARRQLIDLELVAFEAPLYQVLAIAGTTAAPRTASTSPPPPPAARDCGGPVSLADMLEQLEQRRGRL
ncbi:MAG: hypothetical protein RLZZ618_1977 [Pseudomonadota bacterium]|jgi:hypothetical protein